MFTIDRLFSVQAYHKTLPEMYGTYGGIWKETIAGKTTLHLMDPDLIRLVYDTEGKIPHIPPLQETTQKYRKDKDMSLGLGNT